jgi:hypothetical protein
MRSTLLGLLLVGVSLGSVGCDDGVDLSKLVGSYAANVTLFDQSDQNILTLTEGASGTLLFSFTTGLRTDPTGPSPNGLRATVNKSNKLTFTSQPALLDHPTGTAEGRITGTGQITVKAPEDNDLEVTFTFFPESGDDLDLIQPNDMGRPHPTDMGLAVTIGVSAAQQ